MLYFNPRAPYGARLCTSSPKPLILIFQSTRPIRGATAWFCYLVAGAQNFNPRAPYGARPFACFGGLPCSVISIHAPHTGRDGRSRCGRYQGSGDFNPRAPYGARRSCTMILRIVGSISIHAPHTGRDVVAFNLLHVLNSFQSTRPIRGATWPGTAWAMRQPIFQSTRPIRGATRWVQFKARGRLNFNPRAPYGARPAHGVPPGKWDYHFNPRAPYGARQLKKTRNGERRPFQSTRPIRGATVIRLIKGEYHAYFNPRAPYGARLRYPALLWWPSYFNPRAPYGARHGQKYQLRRQ